MVELGGLDQRPDLRADRRQFRRVDRCDLGVFVEQLLQAGDVAVALRAGHRRHEVVDQRGVDPAFGLGALAGVVDEERVDEREVPDRGIGRAGGGQARGFAGQPLQVAVLADVHDRMCTELLADPMVGREVVVRGRQIRVVVDRDGLGPEPAGRLHHHDDVARTQGGQHDLALGVVAAVDEELSGCLAPVSDDVVAQFRISVSKKRAIVGGVDPHRVARELRLGEPVLVLAARGDEGVHQRVASLSASCVADLVTGLAHRGK